MTYLIIGESKESQLDILDMIFERFFKVSFRECYKSLNNPDVHILDGSRMTSIGIEEIKSLQSELFFHPFENSFQAGIVLEAEKLTPEAQNAFLKTLEECNDETLFVLCTTNEKNLLPTIISRCRKIYSSKGNSDSIPTGCEVNIDDSLIKIFNMIEEISSDTQKTLSFLKSLEYSYQNKLEESIKEKNQNKAMNLREDIKHIQTAKIRILASGNKRLVLENMILKLRK